MSDYAGSMHKFTRRPSCRITGSFRLAASGLADLSVSLNALPLPSVLPVASAISDRWDMASCLISRSECESGIKEQSRFEMLC